MNYCIFYFCVLLLATLYAIRKKVNNIGFIILALYTTIAGLSIYICQEERLTWYHVYMSDLKFYPFLVLLIAYTIFFYPLLYSKSILTSDKIVTEIDDRYKFLLIIYIICTILSIINNAATVVQMVLSNDLAANYKLFTLGKEGQFNYYNFGFYLATQISNYTSLLCLIMAFLFLRNKKNIKISIISIVLYFISNLMIALYVSARGMVFEYAMLFLAIFLFVFPNIQKSSKKLIFIFGAIVLSILIPYMINITVSRFTRAGAFDSVLQYFGQPPLIFNGAVQSLEKFYHGKYAFDYLFGRELNLIEFGHTWVQGFYTFVGYFYIDWGIPGIIVIGLIACLVMRKIVRKECYNLSDLLLIFAYYKFLLKGSLVIGSHYIVDFVMTILLYFLMRVFIENNKRKVRITIRGKRI